MNGVNIVGVQFRRAGKIYDFDARDFCLSIGDRVVVETERGPSLAEVKRIAYLEFDGSDALKPITRIASRKDLDAAGRLTPEHAERFTKDKIKELDLDMRVIGVEIQFGGNKVIVYFSAPGRVDFRELVKELAGGLKTRVELKQVGSRDEAKLSGGLGICGREFCCSSFLREFVPVSIKMAKNQNLALNPSKVSGGCGRLLCCLTYEDDTYTLLRQKLLPKGTRVKLPDGILGDVIRGDILNQTMLLELDTGEQRSVPLVDLEIVDARHAVRSDDDWGSDLDFGSLMGEGDIAKLDDSAEVRQHRESASEPIHGGNEIKPRPSRDANEKRPRRGGAPSENEVRTPSNGRQLQPKGEGRAPRAPREEGEAGLARDEDAAIAKVSHEEGSLAPRGSRDEGGAGPRAPREGGRGPREDGRGPREDGRGPRDNRGPEPRGSGEEAGGPRAPREDATLGQRSQEKRSGGRNRGQKRGRGGSDEKREDRRPPRNDRPAAPAGDESGKKPTGVILAITPKKDT